MSKIKQKESRDDRITDSLTEILAILYVTVIILILFLKIMFG